MRAVRSGFTLVEMVIAVVIIGLLAVIAVPRLANSKEHSYVTAMQSDLRNLSTHQESYFYDHQVYTPDLAQLRTRGFQTTSMITVGVVEATSSGWSATADHSLTDKQCALYVGTAAPLGAATTEGVIDCQ